VLISGLYKDKANVILLRVGGRESTGVRGRGSNDTQGKDFGSFPPASTEQTYPRRPKSTLLLTSDVNYASGAYLRANRARDAIKREEETANIVVRMRNTKQVVTTVNKMVF
jgi:hypothetical protein